MTCPNGTAPVNIVNNPELICDLKCEYGFTYPLSGLNITNKETYLSLKTDKTNTPPVTYNTNKYEVSGMRLYQPSLHSYSGKKAEAELIIIHTNISSQGNLLVCVPILAGSGSNNGDSVSIFDTIISEVAKTANSSGTKTTVNIPNFSIDKLIPRKPYYSYNGTLPYSPCNGDYDYVVFSKDNEAFLSMSTNAYEALQKIITVNNSTTATNKNGVFFNKNGPNLASAEKSDIYMECLPTGSDGPETFIPLVKSSEQTFNTETITSLLKNNFILQILLGICIILVLIKLVQWLMQSLTGQSGAGKAGQVKQGMQSGGMRSGHMRSGGMRSGHMRCKT